MRRILEYCGYALFRFTKRFAAHYELKEQLNSLSQRGHFSSMSGAHKATVVNENRDPGLIVVGAETLLTNSMLYVFSYGGRIKIGDYCYIGQGSRIWSAESVTIGDRVFVSHNVNIHDTNAHPIDFNLRHQDQIRKLSGGVLVTNDFGVVAEEIIIEDDVWIGFNSVILKGVRIGERSIVAAGAVVTKDVPRDVVVAGNPAAVIKNLIR